MRILVVDDEPMTLLAISKQLRGKGYSVSAVSNSIEALKIVTGQKVDLIISDIIMPCISGFTLLTMLKNFYFVKIPVILISSYTHENILLKLHGLGVAEFVTKPINYKELFMKIEKYKEGPSAKKGLK